MRTVSGKPGRKNLRLFGRFFCFNKAFLRRAAFLARIRAATSFFRFAACTAFPNRHLRHLRIVGLPAYKKLLPSYTRSRRKRRNPLLQLRVFCERLEWESSFNPQSVFSAYRLWQRAGTSEQRARWPSLPAKAGTKDKDPKHPKAKAYPACRQETYNCRLSTY